MSGLLKIIKRRLTYWSSVLSRRLGDSDRLVLQFSQATFSPSVANSFVSHDLSFTVPEVTFGVEFRVFSLGVVPLKVQADVQLTGPGADN
jgi:hypothetical protein